MPVDSSRPVRFPTHVRDTVRLGQGSSVSRRDERALRDFYQRLVRVRPAFRANRGVSTSVQMSESRAYSIRLKRSLLRSSRSGRDRPVFRECHGRAAALVRPTV